jgi:hypothetical protein
MPLAVLPAVVLLYTRAALQGVFDVREHLTTWWLKTGYFLLTVLFVAFTLVYGWAAAAPLG